MSALRLIAGLRFVARFLLHRDDFTRVVEPGLADAEYELDQSNPQALREAIWGVFVAIGVVFFSRRFRVFRTRQWPGVAAIAAATMLGAWALAEGDVNAARVQIIFLATGLGAALMIGTSDATTLQRASVPLGVLSVLVLIATALLGEEANGARRWIAIGPLFVHAAVLVWPCILAGVAEAMTGNRLYVGVGIGFAAQLALVLQRDLSTLFVLTLAMLAASHAASKVGPALVLMVTGSLAGLVLWTTRVELEPLSDVASVWDLAHSLGPFAMAVGLFASLVGVASPLWAARSSTDALMRSFGVGTSTAMAGFCGRPLLGQDDAVFFLGRGGSPIVGALIMCAIVTAWMPANVESDKTGSSA